MSQLRSLQAELVLLMKKIETACENHGYEAIPTLLLRHEKGANSSILISRDKPSEAARIITELESTDEQSMDTGQARSILARRIGS